MFARLIFAVVDFRARRGLAETPSPVTVVNRDNSDSVDDSNSSAFIAASESVSSEAKLRARRTGMRGETYAYWYLRSKGYVMVARNFMTPGVKGEIDIVGYDGPVLAFIEVKTRSQSAPGQPTPEETVVPEKRRVLSRMAQQFLRARRVDPSNCRFDMVAIETRPGARPTIRLHKGAFARETV